MEEEEFREFITNLKGNSEITEQIIEMARAIGQAETLIAIGFADAMMGRQ